MRREKLLGCRGARAQEIEGWANDTGRTTDSRLDDDDVDDEDADDKEKS